MGERFVRFVSICVVSSLLTVLMAAVSVSFAGVAASDEGMNGNVTIGEERTVTMEVRGTSVLSDIPGIDSPFKSRPRADRGDFEIKLVRHTELPDLHLSDYVMKAPVGDNPSPTGTVDPEPMDAPFLPGDVLVYNDAANSERNVDLAKSTNEDLYAAYDHDIGTGLRDVYVSKSTDGGLTWAKRDIATHVGEDEYCPTVVSDYSPRVGTEMMYVWYNNPILEFGYSQDGDTWSLMDYGGGITWWDDVNCPYADIQGDFMVVVSEYYDSGNLIDTWQIIYTKDGWLTFETYHVNMWPDAWSYQPRVTIMDNDEVYIALDIYDKSDPNPANWWHDTFLFGMLLTGNMANDDFSSGTWGTVYANQVYTAPIIDSDGFNLIFAQEQYDPLAIPLTTTAVICAKADITRYDDTLSWYGCYNDDWFFAFDIADVKNQKYPMIHRDGDAVHLAWLNGTDINYRLSTDGGGNWTGPPMKVNAPGVGTAINAYHSPDIIERRGKACIAWHDSRGSDNIYFQAFQNSRWFEIHTNPTMPQLQVREVGDSWHPSSYFYVWADGSNHDVEAASSYEIPANTRYSFNQWDDGSFLNPTTVTVSSVNREITALYDTSYWLDMQASGGTTTPVSSWQIVNALVTVEAFPPPDPPGGQYVFAGWTGDLTDPRNPCPNCVLIDAPKTVVANWQLQWEVAFDTIPSGLTLQVDGVNNTAPFMAWLNDSQAHNIGAPSPQNAGPAIQYTWMMWSDAGAQYHDVVVSSAGEIFTATFAADYLITIDTNPTGLQVIIDGLDYIAPYTFWCREFSMPWLEAVSPQYLGPLGERYMWRNWSDGGARAHQHTCVDAVTVTANYTLERSMNITTNPAGFNVIVDTLTYATPAQFWWEDASNHTVEALSIIPVGANNRYNFTSWSDFGPRIHDIWANTSDETITANYVFQHKITIQGSHPGITIEVNASPVSLPYVFWCDDGSSFTVNAPFQIFGDTRYVFTDWSDGGTQIHNIICNAPMILQAFYSMEYKVYLNSTLDGAPSMFDVIAGAITYPTPAEVWWPADSMMSLSTDEYQPAVNPASGTRYRFVDWDDSAIRDRTVNINVPGLLFVANFVTQHKLTFVDPHGAPMTTPVGFPVADGIYFDADTVVDIQTDNVVTDTVTHRWRFDSWSSGDPGGYTGTNNPATVTMTAPISQTVAWIDQYKLTLISAYGTPVASGWYEQRSATEYWYDAGDIALFWVESAVIISAGERTFFNGWVGGTNGTAMNAGLTVTASWLLEFLVTVVSSHGTIPAPTWVADGGFYSLSIEDFILAGSSRYYFTGWTTPDTANGGYDGPTRQIILTVTGPITETATWETQHLVTIISAHGTVPSPTWVAEGGSYSLDIEEDVTSGDSRASFTGWTTSDIANGGYQGTNRQVTLTVMGPITETATWETRYLLTIITDYGTPEASNWEDQYNATAFWYSEGDSATFWVGDEVFISTENDAKAVFDGWNGGANGTSVNSATTVTAMWHLEYLVTIESEFGTVPQDVWVRDVQTLQISINETVEDSTNENIRYVFASWSTDDTDVGGYQGAEREHVLTVIGPITETAVWTTQFRLRITSTYGSELEPLGDPTGDGWHDAGSIATVTVEKSEEKGDYVYRFKEWVGGVAQPDQTATTILMDGPKDLSVEWSEEAKFSIMDLWWLFIVIIVVVVAVVAALLVKRKSGKKDEEAADEETSVEETDSAEESEKADEET